MKHEDCFTITIVIMLFGIATLIIACAVQLKRTHVMLKTQFEYVVQHDMCVQDAGAVGAPCIVEQDDNGKYNWYYFPSWVKGE